MRFWLFPWISSRSVNAARGKSACKQQSAKPLSLIHYASSPAVYHSVGQKADRLEFSFFALISRAPPAEIYANDIIDA